MRDLLAAIVELERRLYPQDDDGTEGNWIRTRSTALAYIAALIEGQSKVDLLFTARRIREYRPGAL